MPEPQNPNQNRPLSLLERWKNHPTRRAEFAALLQEPALLDAIAIVREQTFEPRPILPGTHDIIAVAALTGQVREGYMQMLKNFMSLASISPFKTQERKPWDTQDREAALARMRMDELGPEPTPPAPPANGPAPVEPSSTAGPNPAVT